MKEFTGMQYIDIAVANAMGLDKRTWEQRLEWVDNNKDNLLKDINTTKEPYQLLAAVQARKDAIEGVPTGYIMGLDACSSGIQIMAMLAGDLVAATLCGLVNTGNRQDVYQRILDDMVIDLGPLLFTRSDIKEVGMKVLYGSKAEPTKVLEDPAIISSFYRALERHTPLCTDLLFALLECADPTATSYRFTLPDGHVAEPPVLVTNTYTFTVPELDNHPVTHRVTENETKMKDVSIPANFVQAIDGYIVRELGLRCNHNPMILKRAIKLIDSHMTLYLPWTGVASIARAYDLTSNNIKDYDPRELYALRELCEQVLTYPPFEQVSVHDKYFASPNHMNKVRSHVIDIYAGIADSNYMEDAIAELSGNTATINKVNVALGDLIRESEYIIS